MKRLTKGLILAIIICSSFSTSAFALWYVRITPDPEFLIPRHDSEQTSTITLTLKTWVPEKLSPSGRPLTFTISSGVGSFSPDQTATTYQTYTDSQGIATATYVLPANTEPQVVTIKVEVPDLPYMLEPVLVYTLRGVFEIMVGGVWINSPPDVIWITETFTLTAEGIPPGGTITNWTSSNLNIGKINATTGALTGLKEGRVFVSVDYIFEDMTFTSKPVSILIKEFDFNFSIEQSPPPVAGISPLDQPITFICKADPNNDPDVRFVTYKWELLNAKHISGLTTSQAKGTWRSKDFPDIEKAKKKFEKAKEKLSAELSVVKTKVTTCKTLPTPEKRVECLTHWKFKLSMGNLVEKANALRNTALWVTSSAQVDLTVTGRSRRVPTIKKDKLEFVILHFSLLTPEQRSLFEQLKNKITSMVSTGEEIKIFFTLHREDQINQVDSIIAKLEGLLSTIEEIINLAQQLINSF